MKEQDFMDALSGVQQDMLDELAEWQNAKTPVTGGLPEQGSPPAQNESPVLHTRRRNTMKQKNKQKAKIFRLSRWNIGIGAAVAAAVVAAVSIGREAASRRTQMQTANAPEVSVAEQISERKPIEITDYRIEGFDVVMDIPESGTAQLLHTVEDAQPWIELVRQSGEYGRNTGNGAENFRTLLENEEIYHDYDVIMSAVPYQYVYQDYGVAMYGFDGGKVTPDGNLTVEMRFLTVGNEMHEQIFQQIDTFCCCFVVPKNIIPEITAFTFHDVIYDCTAPLPDGCETREEHLDYLYSLPSYQEFMEKELTTKYLCWAEDKEQIKTAGLPEPFSAWYWVIYHGNDIPLPDGMTVQIIRTAEEGKKYLTGSEEQQKTELDSFLTADWLEMPEETIGEPPHDVLFIGVPANQLPENVINFAFQNGTVTPSGKLHLDLSVTTVPDAVMEQVPERQYADDDCFYHFISIPKGAIPELTGWELAFTEYHSDTVTYPDSDAEESGTMEWLYEPGAAKSGRNSTLGMKTITPVPEERPDTVPILYGYMHILDEPCGQADATLKPGAVTGRTNTPGINPADADVIKLTLPLHDASAMAAISDLTVSADGVLTLTLDEYYKDTHEGDGIDLTQDNATLVWYLKVPQCSVPLIKSLSLNRVCNEWIGEGDNRAPSAYYASWKHRVIRLTESVSGAEPDIRALAVSDTAQERLTAEVAAPEVVAVRTQADWQALQERFPNMKLGYDEAVTALFLLVPMQPGESAFTAQSVRIVGDQVYAEITVGQSDADDTYRNTGTAVCRLNIPADEVPEISSALHLQTNTVPADDFNALCSTAPFTDVITVAE